MLPSFSHTGDIKHKLCFLAKFPIIKNTYIFSLTNCQIYHALVYFLFQHTFWKTLQILLSRIHNLSHRRLKLEVANRNRANLSTLWDVDDGRKMHVTITFIPLGFCRTTDQKITIFSNLNPILKKGQLFHLFTCIIL